MKSNWYNGFLQIRRKKGKERVSDTLKKLLVLQKANNIYLVQEPREAQQGALENLDHLKR